MTKKNSTVKSIGNNCALCIYKINQRVSTGIILTSRSKKKTEGGHSPIHLSLCGYVALHWGTIQFCPL